MKFAAFRAPLILIISFFVLPAIAQTDTLPNPIPNFDSVATKVFARAPVYQTLSLRSQMQWDDGDAEQNFAGSIRLQKDSLIWLSLTGPLNIEGARVLISPDTFKIINKLSAEYAIRGFSFLHTWLYFPVTFSMLQQIIEGRKVDIGEKASTVAVEDSLYVLYYESDKLQEKMWVNPVNYTITKIVLKDKMLKQQMTVNFEAYNDLNGNPFSYRRKIEINRNEVVLLLNMEITRVQTDEKLSYPFDITDRYKKIE